MLDDVRAIDFRIIIINVITYCNVVEGPPPSSPSWKIDTLPTTLPSPASSPVRRTSDSNQLLVEGRTGSGFRIQLPLMRTSLTDHSPSPRRVWNVLPFEIGSTVQQGRDIHIRNGLKIFCSTLIVVFNPLTCSGIRWYIVIVYLFIYLF